MHRLENDGLAVKRPYQGWFVREFTEQQIRELYEFRAALELFSVGLACERITQGELAWLRAHQTPGNTALAAGKMGAYPIYNWDLDAAIMRVAKNIYLSSMTGQSSYGAKCWRRTQSVSQIGRSALLKSTNT
jgi:DNA-binding GntR family transcriptional regulator